MATLNLQVICGDALEVLKTLPDECVQMCCTSPPYFGLRAYLPDGHEDKHREIGLEARPSEYVDKLVEVFREVKRVLKDDGVLWCVIGDSYAGSCGAQSRGGPPSENSTLKGNGHVGGGPKLKTLSSVQIEQHPRRVSHTGTIRAPGLKPKDLMMIPARVAIALCDDGWYLRQEIVWAKKAPMPESVTDRCTRSHEMVYMLAKQPRYYYDAASIAEPSVADHPSGNGYKRDCRLSYKDGNGARGNDQQWNGVGGMRNKRSVWEISPEPLLDLHFAAYPTALVKPMVMASTRLGDVVLDPFAGSGTTAKVALELGRKTICIELNPAYCKLIEQRTNVTPGML